MKVCFENLLESQDISHILRNPEVCCRIHNSPSLVPIISQINLLSTLPVHFLKIYFNFFRTLHCNILVIVQYKQTKCIFSKLIF